MSYRDSARILNRIRNQETGATPTTMRNQTESEGQSIYEAMDKIAEITFEENGFTQSGTKKPETTIELTEDVKNTQEACVVSDLSKELEVEISTEEFEAGESINISIDEVCCKHQASKRPCENREKEPKQVRNTVIHVQQGDKTYAIVGKTMDMAMRLLVGFMLTNGLIGSYPITFFADGAKNIKNAVEHYFGFMPYRYVLDWHHLVKKSGELLSSAIKSKDKRNEVLTKLTSILWLGKTIEAIKYLDSLGDDYVKSEKHITNLIEYLGRNEHTIQCYAARQRLDLRISSNRVEKSNDLIVSERQKHNGMSWSKDGSFGLASVRTCQLNSQLGSWVNHKIIRFTFDRHNAA